MAKGTPGRTTGGRRTPTSTSAFGVSRRENHDSSGFYERFSPPEVSADDTVNPPAAMDEIVLGDARDMSRIADNSVALVVTSPPYFAGKAYEEELGEGHIPGSYLEYLEMLRDVFAECVRTLEPGGRIAVNVANLGRKPYRSLAADVIGILQDDLRLLLRGEVIWIKQRAASGNCAWGSFQRPTNPVLRDVTERVIIASKGRFDRARTARQRAKAGLPSDTSLWRDEFMEATLDVWEFPPELATRVGHPAPFPVELPERLIHLFTYRDDLVLDPFMGSGSTAVAAVRSGRHFVGYDMDEAYVARAHERIAEERARMATADGEDGPTTPLIPAVADPDATVDPVGAALAAGHAAKDVAKALLAEAGLTKVRENVPVAGAPVPFVGRDPEGRTWHVDLAGGFTMSRPGLRRADVLWRTLGRAAVLHEVEPKVPLVVLTTGTPAPNTPGGQALRAMCGLDKPIRAVINLGAAEDRARLAALLGGDSATGGGA